MVTVNAYGFSPKRNFRLLIRTLLIAQATPIWFLNALYFKIDSKIIFLRGSFVTIAAPIGFLPAVSPQVSLKIDILFKALSHRLH